MGRNSNGRSSIYEGSDGWWHGRVTVGIKDDGRLDLSIKALQEPDPTEHRPVGKQDPEFEKMLKRFMQRSNERQADIKRNIHNTLLRFAEQSSRSIHPQIDVIARR